MARGTVRSSGSTTARGRPVGADTGKLPDEDGQGKGNGKVKMELEADVNAASSQRSPPRRARHVKKEAGAGETADAPSQAAQVTRRGTRASRSTGSASVAKVEVKEEGGQVFDSDPVVLPKSGKTRASKKRKVEEIETSASATTEAETSKSAALEDPLDGSKKRRKLPAKTAKGTANGAVAIKEDPNAKAASQASTTPQDATEAKPKRKSRKAPPLRASDIVPIRPRNTTSQHWIGAHVSSAGGPHNALLNALKIGANAVALFVRPKMQWASKPMAEESVEEFKDIAKSYGFDSTSNKAEVKEAFGRIVPHGCYLINLGNPDQDKKEKAMGAFLDDLKRCHQLGVKLYNFHPGSTVGECTKEEGCKAIAECINRAHEEVPEVVILLENMAGTGNVIGGKFEELRLVMDHVKDQSRVGVCIDTAHAFAAGYDLRTDETYEATMSELERTIGLRNVRAMHLNDSKADFGSQRDRHENLGQGKIGIEAFHRIMNDERLARIPCVLETPAGEDEEAMHGVWSREVEMLYMLQGLAADGDWSPIHRQMEEIQAIKRAGEDRQKAKGKKVKTEKPVGKAKTKKSAKKEEAESSDLSEEE